MKSEINKFRVWDVENKEFVIDMCLHIDGTLMCDCGRTGYSDDFVIQRFTGLEDKNEKEIYEGDIIKIKYFVGDFAWENMTGEEADRNMKMEGKEYVVEVKQTIHEGINLELVGKVDAGSIHFPLSYIQTSVKIGNIFENPELLTTNKI